ncbi:hypothetical protein ACNKHR_07900 [Shigella flexneri]
MPSPFVAALLPERFVRRALADMGMDSLLIPEEHGRLDAGVCCSRRRVDGALGRLGAPTYVCCTSCRAGQIPSCAKAHEGK